MLTLKYTVKAIAAQHGLIASFMPKPIFGINGSGMHCHQSLFGLDGNNLFFDGNDEFHLSKLAYQFISGQAETCPALAGVVAPTINSTNGSSLAMKPRYILAGLRQTGLALIRIPATRQEWNPGCSGGIALSRPFLQPIPCSFTAMLAAGLDGVDNAFDIPKPLNNINIYHLDEEERARLGVRELPGSLLDALHELDQDVSLTNA